MSKRSHNSRHTRDRKIRPDEIMHVGPISIARFGNRVLMRNAATPDQHRALLDAFASDHQRLIAEIDSTVTTLVDRVQQHEPLEILRYAYGMFALAAIGKVSEADWDSDENARLWALEYIAAIVAATAPKAHDTILVTEESYRLIHTAVRKLHSQVMIWYQVSSRAAGSPVEQDAGANQARLHALAQMHWCGVRKSRYSVHDRQFLSSFVSPHDQVIRDLFGIGAVDLVDGVDQIQNSLQMGLGAAIRDLHDIQRETMAKIPVASIGLEGKKQVEEVLSSLGLLEIAQTAVAKVFGDDLFDVEICAPRMPKTLLDRMSWSPGEETDFLKAGEFRGWPLRVMPGRRRPFLKINGRYYCHVGHNLVDHIYRFLQRTIKAMKPNYQETWNQVQCDTSENLAVDLFQRLLPGSVALRSVRYEWASSTTAEKKWCELDVLVLFDDHLIVAEVKAGSFTDRSPATDFESYRVSLGGLVQRAADQACRFLEYLESAPEVPLYAVDTAGHRVEVLRIRRKQFRHITQCGITVDGLGVFSSEAHSLQSLGVDLRGVLFWSVSIDDLTVIADVFTSPVTFAHFLEERQRAISKPRFQLHDEIDHLGMYIACNAYSGMVDELPEGNVVWNGYGREIDKYFSLLVMDPSSAVRPQQRLPRRIAEIVGALDRSSSPGRCHVASIVLGLSGAARDKLQEAIQQCLEKVHTTGRAHPCTLTGKAGLTVVCSNPKAQALQDEAESIAVSSMLISNADHHLFLRLNFNETDSLVDLNWTFLDRSSIAPQELSEFERKASQLALVRNERELRRRGITKIGRNESCPCGSGRKHKRCCGR